MDGAASLESQSAVDSKVTELLAAWPGRLAVLFDVEKVTFVSSAFLRICMAVAQRIGAARFSVRGTIRR